MRRSSTLGLILVGIVVYGSSCTALLGLDDKPFTGEGTGGSGVATGVGGAGGTTPTSTSTGGSGAMGGGGSGGSSTTGTGGSGGIGGGSVSWVVASQGAGTHTLGGVAIASTGDIWVVGSYQGSFALPGCPMVTTIAGQAVFWAKLDPSGSCQQLHTLTGVGGSEPVDFASGTAIAIDIMTGKLAIAGSFVGVLEDPDALGMQLLSTSMFPDIFVARLDPLDGHVTHKAAYGGGDAEQVTSLVFHNENNNNDLYVAGSFIGTFVAGAPADPISLVSANALLPDGLLLKLSPAGTPLWARRIGGTGHGSVVRGVTFISSAQGVGITGSTGGLVTGMCDSGPSPANNSDVFFAVISKSGQCQYQSLGNATDAAVGRSIDTDSEARIITVGDFKGEVDLGASPPLVALPMKTDGFVARVDWNHGLALPKVATFSSDGNPPIVNQAYGVYVDGLSRIAVTGSYQNSANFSGTSVPSGGGPDAFVASYDPELGLRWVRGFGDAAFQQGRSVAVDPMNDSVVAAGNFQGTLSHAGPKPPTASVGFQSIFVIKLLP